MANSADKTGDPDQPRLVLVTGLSGSGKSSALAALEDIGFFCVDNLPADLLPGLGDQILGDPGRYALTAVGIDARCREPELSELPGLMQSLEARGINVELLFLTAAHRILIQRFSETRRRHPLTRADSTLADAIAREDRLLSELKERSNWVFDTTDINIHQLRHQVWKCVNTGHREFLLVLESFAFKRGLPQDADFVFDARALPNPHWQDALRDSTGRDADCRDWLESQDIVVKYRDDLVAFLQRWLPEFIANQRSYVTIAIGCTGGRHRSVYLTEYLARVLADDTQRLVIQHREMDRLKH